MKPCGRKTVSFLRVGVILLFAALVFFVFSATVTAAVRSRLRKIDDSCSFERVDCGFSALVVRNLDMPRLGISSETVYVLTDGSVFHPVPVYVVLQGVVLQPGIRRNSSGFSSAGHRFPVVSVDGGTIPDYGTEFYGTRISGTDAGYASGSWGEAFAVRSEDSAFIVFNRCTGVPGMTGAFPSLVRGHSVSGRCSGILKPEVLIEGAVTELDGEPASAIFSYSLQGGKPSADIRMDFSQVNKPAMALIDSISLGSVLSVVPSGSLFAGISGADSVFFTVDLHFDSLSVWNTSIAPDTFSTSVALMCSGLVLPGDESLVVDSGSIGLNTINLDFDLVFSWGNRRRLRLTVFNRSLAGGAITESVPPELLGVLNGLVLEGDISVFTDLTLDWDYPDSCDIDIDIDASNLVVGYSPVVFGRISSTGAYCVMHDSWGNTARIGLDILTNPDFVCFDSLPPGFEPLLRCAEDASFRSHRGFSQNHIRNSIRADIADGQFVRGGSTVSMQLAKNLFLGREKTLARKLQEVFLTWRLERWLSKDRILEIYANVVELGPGVFGFNSAAMYYFNESVSDLSIRETAFLVSVLPGPGLYHRYGVQGFLPGYWKSYVERLITICGSRGWLEQSAVSEAVADTLVFDGAVSHL
jgi:hypothetical protein